MAEVCFDYFIFNNFCEQSPWIPQFCVVWESSDFWGWGSYVNIYHDFVLRHYSSLEVASEYFRSGADKISIGSDAVYAAEEYLRTKVSPICYYQFTSVILMAAVCLSRVCF